MSNFIDYAIKLIHMLYYVQSLTPGQLLPSPMANEAEYLPKDLLFGWWSSLVQLLLSP